MWTTRSWLLIASAAAVAALLAWRRRVSGYRGLENQLYRAEIHDGGSPSTASFKWRRDRGSARRGEAGSP
jgi:hypothetical protein